MAARTQKVKLTDQWRLKIKASNVANRLYKCMMGEVKMTAVQVKAADLLFSRLEPALTKSEVTTNQPLLGPQTIPDGALMVVIVRQLAHAGWKPEDAKIVAGELLGLPEKTLGDIDGEAGKEDEE